MKKIRLLQMCIGIFFTFRTVSNWIRQVSGAVPILCLILATLLPTLFGTLLKPQIRSKNRTSREMIYEYAFQSLAAILFFAGIVSTYLANCQVLSNFPYLMFISGLDWVWIVEIFSSFFPRLRSFQLFIPCIFVPVVVDCWILSDIDLYTKVEITIRASILIFSSSIVYHFNSEDSKELFFLKMGLEDKETLYREILDQLPECVLVLSSELEPRYFNDRFRQKIGGDHYAESGGLLETFFDRITDVSETGFELKNANEPQDKRGMRETLEAFQKRSSVQIDQRRLPNQIPEESILSEENKSCRIYRGSMRVEGCEIERTEPVEIKLTKIMFAQEPSLLVIVRKAPEYDLLLKLDQALKYKDEVLAAVSHELRTPLNSNINLINEALRSPQLPEAIRHDLLDPAYKSGKLLLNIVNDILDFSQIKENKIRLVSQVCNVRTILDDCRHLFERQCKQKGIAIEVDAAKSLPYKIRTDPNRLTQVILNLISNAFKFTFEGKIIIRASPISPNGLIQITVTDTGIGIREEDMVKLTKKFEKIDLGDKLALNSTGSGMGLYIANSLAILLGPEDHKQLGLKFKSQVDLGTSVSFVIKSKENFDFNLLTEPSSHTLISSEEDGYSDSIEEDKDLFKHFATVSADDTEFISPITKSVLEKRVRNARYSTQPGISHSLHDGEKKCECPSIMIVDDDCFNSLTVSTMLKSLGISFDTAYSGRECLEKIRKASPCQPSCQRFRLVLMDGNMPIKSGFETTKELIAWNQTLPKPWEINVIGCTAHFGEDKGKEFKTAGAKECITKPLAKEALKKLLMKYNIF